MTGRPDRGPARYIALGDSYTIGTGVEPAASFPSQLVQALGDGSTGLDLVANLGVNGYTTADLIRDELPVLEGLAPDIVSLLIGVNDVVQGVPTVDYEARLTEMLDDLEARVGAGGIVTIAIPDYTVTPAGADYGEPSTRRAAIDAANAVMARQSAARGLSFVDIVDLSRLAATDRSLVAADGLHPSGAQYARWVERIAPVMAERLAELRP